MLFPLVFYIPKWLETQYVHDLPRACHSLKDASQCLIEASTNASQVNNDKVDRITNINRGIEQLLSYYCWINGTAIEGKKRWYLQTTPLRFNIVYYISYYLTLNTLFATILPIGALLFFSLSTVRGLHSIRKLVKISIPMRMSSRCHRPSLR